MQPLRVLYIIDSLSPDGAERQLLGLCRRLDRTRFDASVLCYSSTGDSLVDAFSEIGVPVRVLDRRPGRPGAFFMQLRREIRALAPDVVHTWLYSANFWGRWAAVASGVPVIVASDRLTVVRRHIGRRCVERISEQLLARRTVRLANSLAVVRSLEQNWGLPASRTLVIRNGVESPVGDRGAAREAIRRELGVSQDQRVVLMVARQAAQKNWPMFVRVASQLGEMRADTICVGLGRQDMSEELGALQHALGASGVLRFVAQRRDVHPWLAGADVFCLTSNAEGTPNALLEAMAAGLPVVCTAFAGAEETIPHRGIGLLVPLDDDVAMAGHVAALLDDEEKRRALGNAAREWAARRYSWSRVLTDTEALYERLVAAAHRVVVPAPA
jgi:glycosyltransferase involved in cell wall biosynthesis